MVKLNFDEKGVIFYDEDGAYSVPSSVELPLKLERFEVVDGGIVEKDALKNKSNDEIDEMVLAEQKVEVPTRKQDVISRLKFMESFTMAERIAISKSEDDMIVDFRELLALAETVTLSYTSTQQGLMYLRSIGLIGDETLATLTI